MPLSNFTTFSYVTDNAPLSPSYFNSKFSAIIQNLDQLNTDTSALSASYLSTAGVWHVSAFNVAGNGTDETVGIQSAISHINASGGGKLLFSSVTYLASNLSHLPGVELDLNGGTIIKNGGLAGSRLLNLSGVTLGDYVSSMSSTAPSGSTAFPISSNSGLVAGDYVCIQANRFILSTSQGQDLELNQIASISGVTAYLVNPTLSIYSANNAATIYKLSNATNMIVRNGTIKLNAGTLGGNIGVNLSYAPVFENVTLVGPRDDGGITVDRSAYGTITKCKFRSGQSIGGNGYGNAGQVGESSHHWLVYANFFEQVSEFAFTTRARQSSFLGNVGLGGGASLVNTHGRGCENIVIGENVYFGGGGWGGNGIGVGQSTALAGDINIEVVNNLLMECPGNGIAVAGNSSASSFARGVTIRGNRVLGFAKEVAGQGIAVSQASGVVVAENSVFGGVISVNAGSGINVTGSVDVLVQSNSIRSIPGRGISVTNSVSASTRIDVIGNSVYECANELLRTVGSTNTQVLFMNNRTGPGSVSYASTADIVLNNLYGSGGSSDPGLTISSTSSLVAPFVVQGSASSFTIIVWPAARAGDQVFVTPGPTATVSSISSGLVAHSHCTQNGQVEFRLSNVSTLVQNQSTRTWYFTRISPFAY